MGTWIARSSPSITYSCLPLGGSPNIMPAHAMSDTTLRNPAAKGALAWGGLKLIFPALTLGGEDGLLFLVAEPIWLE